METKEIRLLKKEGTLATQENTALFKLSIILEDYIMQNEKKATETVKFAKRLDNFIWSDNIEYIEL